MWRDKASGCGVQMHFMEERPVDAKRGDGRSGEERRGVWVSFSSQNHGHDHDHNHDHDQTTTKPRPNQSMSTPRPCRSWARVRSSSHQHLGCCTRRHDRNWGWGTGDYRLRKTSDHIPPITQGVDHQFRTNQRHISAPSSLTSHAGAAMSHAKV